MSLCPASGPDGIVVVLVDTSDDLPDPAKRQAAGILDDLITGLPPYYKLDIRVLDIVGARSRSLFSKCNPGDGRGLSEWTTTLQFQLWTKNDISGRDLVVPILERISNSPLLVADITYLNLNVTYEVGYAIGQSKRVLLTRNRSFRGDVDLANDIGIYDTLGRHEYEIFEQLGSYLALQHDLLAIPVDYPLDPVKRLFFLDIPGSSDVVRQIVSAIKREFRLYRSFSDEETIRLRASCRRECVGFKRSSDSVPIR